MKLKFLAKNTHTREHAHEYREYGLSEFTYWSTNNHESVDDFRQSGDGHLAVGRNERFNPPLDGRPLSAENHLLI